MTNNYIYYISPWSYYYYIRKNQIATYSFSEYLENKKSHSDLISKIVTLKK